MEKFDFISIFVVFLCFVLPFPVCAEQNKIIPYISVKQEYSDNVLFSSNNNEDDSITTAGAGVTFFRDMERVDTRLDAKLIQLLYLENDQLNSLDGSASGNWKYKFSEQAAFGVAASFRKDSRRDTDAETTGLILSGDKKEGNFSISSNYLFSETTQAEISFQYRFVELDEINEDEDDESFKLDLAFSKNLTGIFKNTMGLLNFSYMHYTADMRTIVPGSFVSRIYDQDSISDTVQLYTGFSRNITEVYNVYLQAGASYTEATEKQRTSLGFLTSDMNFSDNTSSTLGGVLLAGLNYDGLYYNAGLSISHDIRGATGSDGSVERSAVSMDINRKISDKFSVTLDTSCYLNKNDRKTRTGIDKLTVNVRTGFIYKFSNTLSIQGHYRYTSVENRQNDTNIQRNLVYFVIKKSFHL